MKNHEHQVRAELYVIGAALKKPELIDKLDLTPIDFQAPALQHTFHALQSIAGSNTPIDIVTVGEWLEANYKKNYLSILIEATKECIVPDNGAHHARIIKKRAVSSHAQRIIDQHREKIAGEPEAIDDLIRDLMDLTREKARHECGIDDALRDAITRLDDLTQNGAQLIGVSTGLEKLDSILGGLQKSDLYVLGARPAMGKTALLLNMALAADQPVGIVSAEQPRVQIGARLLAIHGEINALRLRNAKLTDDEWGRVTTAVSALRNKKIRLYDKSAPTIEEIARQARAWIHDHGIRALYVDYLQRIGGLDRRTPRYERVGRTVFGLKELARELDIPVFALAQVSREVERRNNKRPLMSDFKDSGEIEQEADNIATLYRDEVYNAQTSDPGIAEIELLKNRHGPIGFIKTEWHAETMIFRDLPHDGNLSYD